MPSASVVWLWSFSVPGELRIPPEAFRDLAFPIARPALSTKVVRRIVRVDRARLAVEFAVSVWKFGRSASLLKLLIHALVVFYYHASDGTI